MSVNLKTIIIASGQRPRHLAILANQLDNYLLFIDSSGSSKIGLLSTLSRLPAIDMATHYLILQEDIIVCKDFKHTVEKIVENHPDRLISYFSQEPYKHDGLVTRTTFSYAQAYSLPKEMAQHLLMINFKSQTDDGVINEYLRYIKRSHLVTSPSLVEHLGWSHTTTAKEKARLQAYDKRRMAGRFIGLENSGLSIMLQ